MSKSNRPAGYQGRHRARTATVATIMYTLGMLIMICLGASTYGSGQ